MSSVEEEIKQNAARNQDDDEDFCAMKTLNDHKEITLTNANSSPNKLLEYLGCLLPQDVLIYHVAPFFFGPSADWKILYHGSFILSQYEGDPFAGCSLKFFNQPTYLKDLLKMEGLLPYINIVKAGINRLLAKAWHVTRRRFSSSMLNTFLLVELKTRSKTISEFSESRDRLHQPLLRQRSIVMGDLMSNILTDVLLIHTIERRGAPDLFETARGGRLQIIHLSHIEIPYKPDVQSSKKRPLLEKVAYIRTRFRPAIPQRPYDNISENQRMLDDVQPLPFLFSFFFFDALLTSPDFDLVDFTSCKKTTYVDGDIERWLVGVSHVVSQDICYKRKRGELNCLYFHPFSMYTLLQDSKQSGNFVCVHCEAPQIATWTTHSEIYRLVFWGKLLWQESTVTYEDIGTVQVDASRMMFACYDSETHEYVLCDIVPERVKSCSWRLDLPSQITRYTRLYKGANRKLRVSVRALSVFH